MFTVPDYWGLVILIIMVGFLVLSLFLAAASMVTPLQRRGLVVAHWAKPVMLIIVLASSIIGWSSSILELPHDQWWAPVLVFGGFGMLMFIGFRPVLTTFFRFLLRRVGRRTTESKPIESTEPQIPIDSETSESPDRTTFLERMRRIRGFFQLPQSGWFWITLLAAVLAVEVVVVVVLWDWLSGDESVSAIIRNVGLFIAGSLAIPLAIWRAVVADKQASSAQQGLLNERYQKAAEMLGSDVLSVRIGGVHALRDLAMEQPNQYHVRVMRLLCAFARNPVKSGTDWGELATSRIHSGVEFPVLREDLQAVMDVIRVRSKADVQLEERAKFRLQLQYAGLRGATLYGADLRRAFLWGADLSGAYLASTRLDCAYLDGAKLFDTHFSNEGDDPATGLTQQQLDKASRDPNEASPRLTGVLDVDTKKQLVWREKPTAGEE